MPRTEFSPAIEAYAAHAGCSGRTAARHCKSSHPAFIEFCATRPDLAKKKSALATSHAPSSGVSTGGLDVISPVDLTASAPASWRKSPAERTSAERIECEKWEQFILFSHAANTACRGGNMVDAVPYGRIANETLDAYYKAVTKRQQDDLARRTLIPVAEFLTYKIAIQRLAATMLGIRDLASALNPASPGHARTELDKFLEHRLGPEITAIDDATDTIFASAGLYLIEVRNMVAAIESLTIEVEQYFVEEQTKSGSDSTMHGQIVDCLSRFKTQLLPEFKTAA